ncbi:amino acid ABC transporter permease [Hoeflea prorocentri]|uniref:Amino acid ABC transporter permease n=1 Tax=Hoeflea prorocentri TaxID=1922333 RepID=A0A9X3ZH45_9HYPH|nr:amino acid ABC transporter permease [Hoeflea prorocentri]MCY6380385.1 amino acid ABC transporter permease [Hoeflea prorocentri]MDA5398185.1 amino acid ABC transporter permease [Hoeflea prorocentri]
MAMQDVSQGVGQPKVALFNDPKIRGWVYQVVLLVIIAYLAVVGVQNMFANLAAQNIASGFGFIDRNAGFAISQSLIEYNQAESSYGRVYLVGLLNTISVAFVGIIIATILGFLIGIARLSQNYIIRLVASVYVEVFRNIPLLLHIFIWYFGVLRLLPAARESLGLGAFGMINIRGWFAPKPIPQDLSFLTFLAFVIGIVATVVIYYWSRQRQMRTGQQFPIVWTALGLIVALPIVVFVVTGAPLEFEYAEMGRFRPTGGMTIVPEFIALLLALASYTAAFIAEIVRAGILAVNKGQSEASHALGLRNSPTLRLVIIPQAMRVIIPPLTSQYLNLTKNSSLAVAIAYPDLTSVFAGTALNQTGQAVEILTMTMLTYLALSLLTAAFMNWYNARMALVER